MSAEAHLWRIGDDDQLNEITPGSLDLESRLQEWLAGDISILDPALLVIGREVETDFGGFIDILCIDAEGDLAVVELKRDRTPKDVTAQALDYASWVRGLSNESVTAIAEDYLGSDLEGAFNRSFGCELPETLNGDHRILIVGSMIDPRSERIIRYLSDDHGVNINAATFQYFPQPDGTPLLARVFVLEPSEVERNTRTMGSSKRRPSLSYEELSELADENGVADIYGHAVSALQGSKVLWWKRTRSALSFVHNFDGSRRVILNLVPGESDADRGLCFRVYRDIFAELAGIPSAEVEAVMPADRQDWRLEPGTQWEGYECFFKSREEIDQLVEVLKGSMRRTDS